MLSLSAVVPERSDDPGEVASLVARAGAAVLTGADVSAGGLRDCAGSVLADAVRAVAPAVAVVDGPARPPCPALLTDGCSYGDRLCDHTLIGCLRVGTPAAADGWYLVDTLRLLPLLEPELAGFLTDHPVDQSWPGCAPPTSPSPLALKTARGRMAVRAVPWARALPGAKNPGRVARLVEQWSDACDQAAAAVPRFRLAPGEVLVVDNYRVLQGRDLAAAERFLWRVWVWTASGNGVPELPLHSDERYARMALPSSA